MGAKSAGGIFLLQKSGTLPPPQGATTKTRREEEDKCGMNLAAVFMTPLSSSIQHYGSNVGLLPESFFIRTTYRKMYTVQVRRKEPICIQKAL